MADVLHPAQLVARRRAVRKARARRIRRIAVSVLSAASLTYGGWAIAHSSLFALDGVDVLGAPHVARADILSAGHIRLGMNLLAVDPATISKRLETLPLVARAKVERIYPSKIRVQITERSPVAVFETPEGRWLLDAGGRVLGVAQAPTRGLATIRSNDASPVTLGASITDPGTLAGLLVWQSLPAPLRSKIVTMTAGGGEAISVDLGGITVVFGSSLKIPQKVIALQAVLDNARRAGKTVVLVDVTAPDRPAARFR